jgi:hypothetical protein
MMRLLSLLLMALLALAGCSAPDFSGAEAGIGRLHQAQFTEDFQDIYRASADDLKHATTESDFVHFLSVTHSKLGAMQSTNQTGKSFNITTNGTYVTLFYHTVFEKGSAQETFVYVSREQKTLLAGYHIESMALLEN